MHYREEQKNKQKQKFFGCDNLQVNSPDAVFTLKSNPPRMYTCMHVTGQHSPAEDEPDPTSFLHQGKLFFLGHPHGASSQCITYSPVQMNEKGSVFNAEECLYEHGVLFCFLFFSLNYIFFPLTRSHAL